MFKNYFAILFSIFTLVSFGQNDTNSNFSNPSQETQELVLPVETSEGVASEVSTSVVVTTETTKELGMDQKIDKAFGAIFTPTFKFKIL
mgnify:CR=1 FL=1